LVFSRDAINVNPKYPITPHNTFHDFITHPPAIPRFGPLPQRHNAEKIGNPDATIIATELIVP